MKWLGSQTKCDICNEDLNAFEYFYDARTLTGQWALLCETCWQEFTFQKLGTGFGQKYNSTTKEKVEG